MVSKGTTASLRPDFLLAPLAAVEAVIIMLLLVELVVPAVALETCRLLTMTAGQQVVVLAPMVESLTLVMRTAQAVAAAVQQARTLQLLLEAMAVTVT
jgi:hypothetical protein